MSKCRNSFSTASSIALLIMKTRPQSVGIGRVRMRK
jgi:hypothetical protein